MNKARIKSLERGIKRDKHVIGAFVIFLVMMFGNAGICITHKIYPFLGVPISLGAIDVIVLNHVLKCMREKQAELKIRRGR